MKDMKVLIYTASSMCNPQFGIQMEHAIDYVNKGHDVVFCHCAGAMSACSANPYQNKAICKACRFGFKVGLKQLPSLVKVVAMKDEQLQKEYIRKDFRSVKDIKSYQYKGVDLGFSVMSVYITKTRNPNPPITEDFLDCVNSLLCQAERLVDAAESIIESENPDLIIFFNGRFFDTKPFHHLAIKHHIDFITTENMGGIRAGKDYRMMDYKNTIPHDSKTIYENCLASWNLSKRSEEEKITIGKSFYEKRRNGQKAGDYVYTATQTKGKLPADFNKFNKNVVIFTSSEDEFSAVSAQVDSYYLFPSQYDCIKFISENIQDDSYHFIVRIHPNMRGLDVEYHRNLYKLRDLKNVTVIAPEEDISSYSLLDVAYNLVVFGSTIGAEAMYWGKPVVLMGFAAYYEWGCCSIPTSKLETLEMIKAPTIYPNAKDMAIKFGYYYLENGIAKKSEHVNITPVKSCYLGRDTYSFDYLRIWGSTLLFKIIRGIFLKTISVFCHNKIDLPIHC